MTDTTTTPTSTSPMTDPVDPAVTPPVDPALVDPEDPSLISKGDPVKAPEAQPPLTPADLALPEGTEIDEASQGKFIDILNENLPRKELADKLLNLQTEMNQAASDSISDAWETMQEEWKTAANAHPDFGGDKLAPALGSIKEMINGVMGEEAAVGVFDALDLTGVGSHPALISLLNKLAIERAEGKATVGSPTPAPQSLADAMFPNQGQ